MIHKYIIVLFLLLITSAALPGQEMNPDQLEESPSLNSLGSKFVVDVDQNVPCVSYGPEGEIGGFEVELWKAIAERLELQVEFRKAESFAHIFDGLKSGEADMAMAGITIRADREALGDFTHSTVPSRLAVLVPADAQINYWTSIWDWCANLAPTAAVMGVFILVMAPIIWLAERSAVEAEDAEFRRQFAEGMGDAVDFAIVTSTSTGFGNRTPRTLVGRLASYVLMFVGIALTGVVCSKVTTFELKRGSDSAIHSPYDLAGRIVTTVEGTSSVDALKKYGAMPFAVENLEQATELLLQGEVAAVVYDWPMLQHYANGEGKGKVDIALEFEDQDYGFLLQKDSSYREDINRVLLELRSEGVYQQLFEKYFM